MSRAWVTPPPVTVKLLELVAVPAGVVTRILPVAAPLGTVVVIRCALVTEKVAVTLLKVTAVAPVKLVPLIVTDVPTGPDVGENEVIVGAPVVTVKLLELVAVPAGVVTEILPVVAPLGTVALIRPAFCTENVALTPLNLTEVAPVKLVPLILTDVPTGPLVGLKDEIVGAAPAVTVKLVELVAVPAGVVTLIGPVVAPDGTLVLICVPAPFTENVADVLLKVTDVAPLKFVPLTATDVPTGPLVGLKDEIVGAAPAVTVKFVELVAVPAGVVTEMAPDVAPFGTVAVSWLDET